VGHFLIAEGFSVVANSKTGSHSVKGRRIVVEKKRAAKPHAAAKVDARVTIDRRESRERRSESDRRNHAAPVAVERRSLERRVKVNRRRQIDPTTCERDYTPDEIEFMGAMDEYKRRNGRMFPTCSEVLEVVKSLGYAKCPKTEAPALPAIDLPLAATQIPAVAG
jgi:hypothetical protein